MRSDEVSADVKVFIKSKASPGHTPGLGLGVVKLCERVQQFGSLNKAAADMGMAYSKAWRIIKNTEEGLGLTLFGVQQFGSLNKAAADMGMAYSKAWRIIKNTEEGLGLTLFVRQGARGSHLTPEAEALIALYRRIERETTECANRVLRESLEELIENGVISRSTVPNLEKKATPELIAQVRALGL